MKTTLNVIIITLYFIIFNPLFADNKTVTPSLNDTADSHFVTVTDTDGCTAAESAITSDSTLAVNINEICEETFESVVFLGQSSSNYTTSQISTIELYSFADSPIGAPMPFPINGIGYNWLDNHIYGMSGDSDGVAQLYKIHPDGCYQNLATIAPPPGALGAVVLWHVGDVDQNGVFHFPAVAVESINPLSYSLYLGAIDLSLPLDTTISPIYSLINTADCQTYVDQFASELLNYYSSGQTGPMPEGGIQDWAFNPNDGLFYSYLGIDAVLFTLEPTTGNTNCYPTSNTGLNEFGAVFFDQEGTFFGVDSETGILYEISTDCPGPFCGSLCYQAQFQGGSDAASIVYRQTCDTASLDSNVSCYRYNDGISTATVTGGTSPYTYLWDNGEITATATALSADTHFITVTDANGYTATASVIITEPPLLTVNATLTSNAGCNGNTGENATATAAGGTPPYTFLWSNGATTATATGLTEGIHFTTVTDANYCTAKTSIYAAVQPIAAYITTAKSSPCAGDSTTLTANWTGSPVCFYLWSDGSNSQQIVVSDTITATYSVTITDTNDCQKVATRRIFAPQNSYTVQTINQLIFRVPAEYSPQELADALCGDLVKTCDCDSLALIAFDDIPVGDNIDLDIEEKKRNAASTLDVESDVNYEFKYCPESPIPTCVTMADAPILNKVVYGIIDSGIGEYSDSLPDHYQRVAGLTECGTYSDGVSEGGEIIGFNGKNDSSLTSTILHGPHLDNIIYQHPDDQIRAFIAKVFDQTQAAQEKNTLFDAICALEFFINYNQTVSDPAEKVRAVNFSMGMYGSKPEILKETIRKAGQEDILVICSAGNAGTNLDIPSDTITYMETFLKADSLIMDTIPKTALLDTFSASCSIDEYVIIDSPLDTININAILDTINQNTVVLIRDTVFIDTSVERSILLDHWPSKFDLDNILAVGAWNNTGNGSIASFSNTGGTSVDILFPGYGIESEVPRTLDTYDGDGLVTIDGTSQATALATRWYLRKCAENPGLGYSSLLTLMQDEAQQNTDIGVDAAWGVYPADSMMISYEGTCTPAEIDEPPTAVDDFYETEKGTPLEVLSTYTTALLANDYDRDGELIVCATLEDTSTIHPDNTIVIDSSGGFTYTPASNFCGTDTFEYEICDTSEPIYCDQAVITIIVNINEQICIDVKLWVWLEGNLDTTAAGGAGEMTTFLNLKDNSLLHRGVLPGQKKVKEGLGATAPFQPYNKPPWNYLGVEGTTDFTPWYFAPGSTDSMATVLYEEPNDSIYAFYHPDVVDWVLVRFRTGTISEMTIVEQTAAALLCKDGSIRFLEPCVLQLDGLSSNMVWGQVDHRNHMAVMTPNPIDVSCGEFYWDFRNQDSYKTLQSSGQKKVASSTWVMYAGDADQDKDSINYDITGQDYILWGVQNGKSDQYLEGDYQLNADVTAGDKNIWIENSGISNRVPK